MSVLRRRTRAVSFRVSEEEYYSLQRACRAAGAQSLSEYVRRIACGLLTQRRPASTELNALYARLEELEQKIRCLAIA